MLPDLNVLVKDDTRTFVAAHLAFRTGVRRFAGSGLGHAILARDLAAKLAV
jgi:hypothetical protein